MPNITAKPHPKMMTGQVFAPILKSPKTATTPSPKRINTIVPKNSPIISPQVPARADGAAGDRLAIVGYSFSMSKEWRRTETVFHRKMIITTRDALQNWSVGTTFMVAPTDITSSRLLPVHGAFDGALPARVELVALVGAHLRLEGAVDGPLLGHFRLAAPEADRQARQVGRAE